MTDKEKNDRDESSGDEHASIPRNESTVLLTGATSLIGRLVIAELLGRGCRVYALLRPSSPYTAKTISTSIRGVPHLPWDRLSVLRGDVWQPDLGLGPSIVSRLSKVTEIIHLARPRAGEETEPDALIRGLDNVIELERRLKSVRRLVVLSSTEISGDYPGRFYEDWLDIGQELSTGASRGTVELEKRARDASDFVPISVARHAMLVGHSQTGQMECDAGFSKLFDWGVVASRLPSIFRLPVPAEGQRFVSISPVDYVARGIVEIAFNSEVNDGETFCLSDPNPPTVAELFELMIDRIGAPLPGLRLPVEGRGPIGWTVGLMARAGASMSKVIRKEPGPFAYFIQRGEHDTSNARRVLEPAGVTCPKLPTYLDALYEDYRQRHGRFQ